MMYKEEIVLASVSAGRDKDGFSKVAVQITEAFADVESVKRSEFYEALRSGIAMDITFKVRSVDYDRQKYVMWEGVWYRVVRDYREEDWTELNCEEIKSLEKWMMEVNADADHQ